MGEGKREAGDGETGDESDADGRRRVARPRDERAAHDEHEEERGQTFGHDGAPKVQRSDFRLVLIFLRWSRG